MMELAHAMEDMHQTVKQYDPARWRRPESRELRGKFAGYVLVAQEMEECGTKVEALHRVQAMIRLSDTFRKGGIHSDYEQGALHAYQETIGLLQRKGQNQTLLNARRILMSRIDALREAIIQDLEDSPENERLD